MASGTET
ncbi:hypothetical protein D049_3476A, partial [Vibrio parahaemolyticus VPTS-2010]